MGRVSQHGHLNLFDCMTDSTQEFICIVLTAHTGNELCAVSKFLIPSSKSLIDAVDVRVPDLNFALFQ